MNLRTPGIIAVVTVMLGGLAATLMVRRQARENIRAQDEVLQQEANRLAALNASCERLSNQPAQVQGASAEDLTAELLKLRAEADLLRERSNEIRKQVDERSLSATEPVRSKPKAAVSNWGSLFVVTDSELEGHAEQLSKMAAGEGNGQTRNARNLTYAVRQYARAHEGEVPSTFVEAAPYQRKGELPLAANHTDQDTLAGIDDFEIIYHGSLSELAGIPEQAVALIRQRTPWPTPDGKWARIYVMADGRLYVVESEDHFQSWEAEHWIPPPP